MNCDIFQSTKEYLPTLVRTTAYLPTQFFYKKDSY